MLAQQRKKELFGEGSEEEQSEPELSEAPVREAPKVK